MKRLLAASVAVMALSAGYALAQSSTQTPGQMPGRSMTPGQTQGQQGQGQSGQLSFQKSPQANQVLATELMDADVYGSDGNAIGEISDILLDQSGQIHSVVFGVGGFLGMGEKNVAVSFNSLQVSSMPASSSSRQGVTGSGSDWNSNHRITLNATREQLQSAPEFSSQRTTTTGSLAKPEGGAR